MPERAEIFIQHKQIQYFIDSTTPKDRGLRALWVDPTTAEQNKAPVHSRAREGLVYALTPGDTLRRGQKKSRKNANDTHPRRKVANNIEDNEPGFAIYPAWLCPDLSSSSFVLTRSPFNPRALIFEFSDGEGNTLCAEVRLFLHVSTQIFTKSEWKQSICKVSRDARGFKVAIAFDMGKYVLALLAHDLLFRVQWAASLERLPSIHLSDVLTDWPGFLRDVSWWVQRRRTNARSRTGPAFVTVHSADVFSGLGVYSISEVFHRAGLPLSLSEQSLFDNASRTARFCVAFRAFAAECEMKLWPFVMRYFHGFKFAVERSDRLFYGRYLRVYGKAQTWVCQRQSILLDEASQTMTTNQKGIVNDPFEPSLVREALVMPHNNLGHLIFGAEEWVRLRALWGIQVTPAKKPDALTRLYRSFQLAEKTFLAVKCYDGGLDGGQWNARRMQTSLYRFYTKPIDSSSPLLAIPRSRRLGKGTPDDDDEDDSEEDDADITTKKKKKKKKKKKNRTYQAWTVIPCINVASNVQCHLAKLPEYIRMASTLKARITTTDTYTVGPTDFCGIARLERAQGPGDPILFLCENDPAVPSFYRNRRTLANSHLKSHFTAAMRRRVRKQTKKKGPSHKKKLHSTYSRRSPKTADQLALEEAKLYLGRGL